MPVLDLSNNQLLPANQRASDVAAFAVEGIVPIQQQKTNAAFHVQGIQCVVYHRLNNGRKCSCQSSGFKLNTRLGKDGKASAGVINHLLTGGDFGISEYNGSTTASHEESRRNSTVVLSYSGEDPSSSDLPTIWNSARDDSFNENPIGTDGVDTNEDLDYGGFDYESLNFGDSSCPVCFGSGYVGGYVVYNGHRRVIPCEDMYIGDAGILNVEDLPYSATTNIVSFDIVLPKGVVGIDACRLLNGWEEVRCVMTLDGVPLSRSSLLPRCDGKKHKIVCLFDEQKITHFEFQANLSKKSAYLEFPKLSKNSRMDIVDKLDDFQLLFSPDIPIISQQDIICDCMWGKVYFVQNTTWQNTRQRQMMGWEANVRVIQPQEGFYHLPRRSGVRTRNATANPSVGNFGNRV